MFTGIIDHCGTLLKIEKIPSGLRLKIQSLFLDLKLGESIAINGICLTVTGYDQNIFYCDLSPETLNATTAKYFQVNQIVNLERALLLSARLGGHFVMGHVDQIVYVKKIHPHANFKEIIFTGLNSEEKKLVFKKGSIAINGVSLTVNDVSAESFSVMLIPYTLDHTQLSLLHENDTVNIEFDMIARIVVQQTNRVISNE